MIKTVTLVNETKYILNISVTSTDRERYYSAGPNFILQIVDFQKITIKNPITQDWHTIEYVLEKNKLLRESKFFKSKEIEMEESNSYEITFILKH